MKKIIKEMHKSLDENHYISFVTSNENYDFGLRKNDTIESLDDKRILIHRESGYKTIINLDLIIGVCFQREWK